MADQRRQSPASTGHSTIAILGAGALGRLWAGCLPAGQTAFVPRPQPSGAWEPTGKPPATYQLQGIDGARRTVSVRWFDPADESPALLLVATKAGDTLTALDSIMPDLDASVPVVLFQNGMGSQQAVAECWPERPILAASTTEGANRPEPDLLVHAGRGKTWIGALTGHGHGCLTPVVTRLATSGLEVQAEADILRRLWQKLVINAGINPFTAILDCPNGDILIHPFYREHIDGLCQEIHQLMDKERMATEAPARIREQIEAVARSTARNTSSMRSDIQRGRTTEIDYINGYIARRGEALGIAVPVNRMLTERVKQL